VGAIWLAVVAAREARALPVVAAALMFAFLCELYIFTFTLVANSVAVSLLLTVRGGCTSAAALEQLYRPEAMVQRRLDQLERAALIRRTRGTLTVTEAGLRLIRTFTRVTALIRPSAN
jgi:DNA-binding MarR family transcriptional regulator